MAANTSEERIEQLRKMAKANPEDELAHYALGSVLLESDRHAEAVVALRYVLRLNPDYSRAYLLLGQGHAGIGDLDSATASWQRGYEVATRRGELQPAQEMKALLQAQGVIPAEPSGPAASLEPAAAGGEPGPGQVRDIRTGTTGTQMSFQPFEDELGAFIYENVSEESWQAWMDMSTKVVNELRLDLGDPAAQRTWDLHMKDFLRLPDRLFE